MQNKCFLLRNHCGPTGDGTSNSKWCSPAAAPVPGLGSCTRLPALKNPKFVNARKLWNAARGFIPETNLKSLQAVDKLVSPFLPSFIVPSVKWGHDKSEPFAAGVSLGGVQVTGDTELSSNAKAGLLPGDSVRRNTLQTEMLLNYLCS